MHAQKTSMGKRTLRIGDLAKELAVERYVIRFWEKEFGLASDRSQGGQRFYTVADQELFSRIKSLLYEQGFTISGAKKQLKAKKTPKDSARIIAAKKEPSFDSKKHQDFMQQIRSIKQDLLELERLL